MATTATNSAKSTRRSHEQSSPPAFPLLARMDELVDGLRDLVPRALEKFDEEAVHQGRVSTRRIHAALNLLKPVLAKDGRKPFSRVLRKLRGRLGPLRDLDVMIDHLSDQHKDSRRHPAAAGWVRDELRRKRDDARKRAGRKSSTARILARLGAWWGLRHEVDEAREAVPSLLAESLHLQIDAFAEQADRVLRSVAAVAATADARAAHADADADVDADKIGEERRGADFPEKASDTLGQSFAASDTVAAAQHPQVDLHELRIAGKALRYTLEIAAVEGHPLPRGVARAFKKMQEALGLWHDYVVLSDTALRASLDSGLAYHDGAMQAAVLDLARAMLLCAARELEHFSALWRDQGEELSRTIRAAFPLTRSLEGSADSTAENAAPVEDSATASASAPAVPVTGATDVTAMAHQKVTGSKTGPGRRGSKGRRVLEAPAPDATSAA